MPLSSIPRRGRSAVGACFGAILLPAALLLAGPAAVAARDCEALAADKKLHGAAKNSFIKKCQAEGGPPSCEARATEKKLHGAAKTSFIKKCEKDAKG